MKRIAGILLLTFITVSACAQLNPTTHIKPGVDTTQILLTRKTAPHRLVYRDLYSYLADTLGFGLTIVDSTRLTADSILIYYNSGSEVGRDTIRIADGGGVVDSTRLLQDSILAYYQTGSEIGRDTIRLPYLPGGDSLSVQINNGLGGFAGYPEFVYFPSLDYLAAGNAIGVANEIIFTDDFNTYIENLVSDQIDIVVGGVDPFVRFTEGSADYMQLGTGVGINLSSTSLINDASGSTGSTGQILKRTASGVTWQNESTSAPGGSDTYVQYNDGGSFGGESTFTYNDATNQLTVEDLEVTTGLYDGASSLGTNYELLTSTGTESRWKTISNSITGRYLYINLDGTTIGAGVDLSDANLSDAGKVFNNSVAQNFYQVSPTKITNWGTTASFSGTGINWDSTNDEWDLTANGKYRVKCMINIDGTAEATATPIRFEIRIDSGSGDTKQGIYYHYYADPDRNITCSIDEVFSLSSGDSITIYVQRGDAGTGKTITMSTTNESYFMVERINY